MGELALLNVGTGDTKIKFDPNNPDEAKNSARMLRDLIRRGYAILVEVGKDNKGPLYRRAYDFDEETHEYIVAGVPEESSLVPEQPDTQPQEEKPRAARGKAQTGATGRGNRRGKRQTTRVAAAGAKAVAVPRTSGG